MKKSTYILLLLAASISLLLGFKQIQPHSARKNMIIVIEGSGLDKKVHISEEGTSYQMKSIKGKDDFDYTQAWTLIRQYETEGWQIQESNFEKSTVEDPGYRPDHFNVLYFRLTK
jgi:hypothetical protein